jgi:hypothetical protein
MDFDTQVKLAIYNHFAATGKAPSTGDVAASIDTGVENVLESYQRLRAQRLLVLEADGAVFRRAHPAHRRSRWHPLLCQLRLGCARHHGGLVEGCDRSLPMCAVWRAFASPSRSSRTGPFRLALTLPGPCGEMVGRYCLHLKQHALLPVGGTGSRLVHGTRGPGTTAGAHRSTLDTCHHLVFDPPAG